MSHVKIGVAVLLVVLLGLLGSVSSTVAEPMSNGKDQSQGKTDAERYHERAVQRMKFQKCYQLGRVNCFEKYREAVAWCRQNWSRCFPLIDGLGTHASTYGSQVVERCKQELRQKCRREAGK